MPMTFVMSIKFSTLDATGAQQDTKNTKTHQPDNKGG